LQREDFSSQDAHPPGFHQDLESQIMDVGGQGGYQGKSGGLKALFVIKFSMLQHTFLNTTKYITPHRTAQPARQ
jgi:hypothetical protein